MSYLLVVFSLSSQVTFVPDAQDVHMYAADLCSQQIVPDCTTGHSFLLLPLQLPLSPLLSSNLSLVLPDSSQTLCHFNPRQYCKRHYKLFCVCVVNLSLANYHNRKENGMQFSYITY